MAKVMKADERLAWWREARFGMFIHWGLYAVPAGIWKGKEIPGIGEWIMKRAEIPVSEYEKLTQKFNPTKFNAKEWVKLAKDAGMRYIVITAKHHDGFALYQSKTSTYNIVDATPYNSDPLKELAKECAKSKIKLCFYYSQDQDWHEPGGRGNDWDFKRLTDKAFADYLATKVEPQLRELLTEYGPVGLIWFDTPGIITKKQSLKLKRLVHQYQPACLVSGRVGHDVGDYSSMGDNQIPAGPAKGAWETPATLNDTWGFKKNDKNWKSTRDLLILLVDLASKGVNYLLNVGPTAKGIIPAPSVKRLEDIGAWMKTNGESIYGSNPNPFPYEFPWGRITLGEDKLYLHFFSWPKKSFVLKGIKSGVKRAYLLTDKRKSLQLSQVYDSRIREHQLVIDLSGKAPDPNVSVVALQLDEELKIDRSLMQWADSTLKLPAHLATITPAPKETAIEVNRAGVITGWRHPKTIVSWKFKVATPGTYNVCISTSAVDRPRIWKGGHEVVIEVAGTKLRKKIRKDEIIEGPRTQYFPEVASKIGKVDFPKVGTFNLTMSVPAVNKAIPSGMSLSYIELTPQK